MSDDSSVLPADAVADVVGAPRWDARTWLAVLSLASATFALVSAEFLPAGLLTPMAADLRISEGTAGQVVHCYGHHRRRRGAVHQRRHRPARP